MKRSSAPSQLFKKPRFLPPKTGNNGSTVSDCFQGSCLPSQTSKLSPNNENSTPEILRILDEVDSEIETESLAAAVHAGPPTQAIVKNAGSVSWVKQVEDRSPSADARNGNAASAAPSNMRYFSVMWCKMSAKKHKIWEGDAFLLVEGKSATMKDTEGKLLSRGVGYKVQQLQNLEDGQLLSVGGKQCQIQNEISFEEFCSTCQAPKASDKQEVVSFERAQRFIINKLSFRCPQTTSLVPCLEWISRPDALVMPRPSNTHQWKYNPKGLPITDVAVDPRLSRHLRPHQRHGVTFLYQCIMGMKDFEGQGAILADEMGLGKTLQCIALLWTVLKQGPYGGRPTVRRALIVTPGSLVKNWEREFRKWLGIGQLPVYAVNSKCTVKEYMKSGLQPILILSYEMFLRHCQILKDVNFHVLVCDEGHRLKNAGIRTAHALSSLGTTRRILLTGTPVQNDLQELYTLVDFCNPGLLGSATEFGASFAKPITRGMQRHQSMDVDEDSSVGEFPTGNEGRLCRDELSRLTSHCLLRRTHEVISHLLPPKVEYVVMCEPSQLQRTLYNQLVTSEASDFLEVLSVGGGGAGQHLRCLGWLRKVCNHPGLLLKALLKKKSELSPTLRNIVKSFPPSYSQQDFSHVLTNGRHLEHSGKLSVLDALLSALHKGRPKEKVVLISGHTQTLDVLSELCNCRGYHTLRLDGSTPLDKRQAFLEDFNSTTSQCFVFLLSSRAGGLGLSLVGGSRVVIFDPDWNPATDLQALARVWRHGQKRLVHAYKLLTAGSLEETIFQRQLRKQALSGAVIDSHDITPGSFSSQDLKELLCPLRDSSHTHDLLDCRCLDETDLDNVSGEDALDLNVLDIQENFFLEDNVRTCQLGNEHSEKCKNSDWTDLEQWSHIPKAKVQLEVQDVYLAEAYKSISFVFKKRSTSTDDTNLQM